MIAIKRILVPVDFSPCSASALEYAVRLAENFGASVDVLHVIDTPSYLWPGVGEAVIHTPEGRRTLAEFVVARAGAELDGLLNATEQRVGRVARAAALKGRARVEIGDAAETIIQAAAKEAYDLIVMGTHGRRGVSHLVMGSLAEKVVQRAPCPVTTVREPLASAAVEQGRRAAVA